MMKLALYVGVAALGLIGAAHAADLAMPRGVVSEAAPSGWDGGYIGANVGYGPGTATATDEDCFGQDSYYDCTDSSMDFSGIFAGVQAGYNVSFGNIVAGVEGDVNWTNETGNNNADTTSDEYDAYSLRLNWTGALTGHVGYDFDGIMPYVLGGVAFANNTITEQYSGEGTEGGSTTKTHVGVTVGAGVAAMLASNVSVFAEARYSDYGIQDYTWEDNSADAGPVTMSDSTIRAGLNFHFK